MKLAELLAEANRNPERAKWDADIKEQAKEFGVTYKVERLADDWHYWMTGRVSSLRELYADIWMRVQDATGDADFDEYFNVEQTDLSALVDNDTEEGKALAAKLAKRKENIPKADPIMTVDFDFLHDADRDNDNEDDDHF